MKQKIKTIKSNLLKYDKKSDQILLSIEIPKKTISAKTTSSKQLVLTKTTYVNFEKIL